MHGIRVSLRIIDVAKIAAAEEGALSGALSDDEHRRVSSALDAESGRRFLIVRGALRTILAQRLGDDRRALRFEYSRWGKPRLASGKHRPRFNLSHCGDLACIAIADEVELGVDIESLDGRERLQPINVDEVGRHLFVPSELQALDGLSERVRAAAFYDVWTRREAVLKTIGSGFAEPPQAFAVPIEPDIGSCEVKVRDASGADRRFTLTTLGETPRAIDLGLGPRIVGALSLERCESFEIEVRRFPMT